MKSAFKTASAVFMVMMFAVGFTACGGYIIPGPNQHQYQIVVEGNVTLSVQTAIQEEMLSYHVFVKEFENTYPEASVSLDTFVGDLDARIASGDIGDVFVFNADKLSRLVETRSLVMLDLYVLHLGFDFSNIYSAAYDAGKYNGRLYMVSVDYKRLSLVANKDALSEAGLDLPSNDWTWREFREDYAPKLVKMNEDGTYSQVPMFLDLNRDLVYISFLEGWGSKWYDTVNRRINLLSDEAVLSGITEMFEAADEGYLYPTGKNTSAYDGLEKPDYVFHQMLYSNLKDYGEEYDALGVDWDIASFPLMPTPKVGTYTMGAGVYSRTNRPNTAAVLALFFYTEEGQKAFHGEKGGGVPVFKTFEKADFWRKRESSWDGKNLDAFICYPEYDTVGRLSARVPEDVANLIKTSWSLMLEQYFNGTKHFMDWLDEIEREASEYWDRMD